MEIKAVDITTIDFSRYGKVLDLRNGGPGLLTSRGEDYSDISTKLPIIDTMASFGCTLSEPVPFTAKQMERHAHTQEAQICAEEPIVFLVSEPTPEGVPPKAENTIAVMLPIGYAAVLERNVWHSASHCVHSRNHYYWLAYAYEGEPTEWVDINGGPIKVVL